MLLIAGVFLFLNQWVLAIVLSYLVAVSALIGGTVHTVKSKRSPTLKKSVKLSAMEKEKRIFETA